MGSLLLMMIRRGLLARRRFGDLRDIRVENIGLFLTVSMSLVIAITWLWVSAFCGACHEVLKLWKTYVGLAGNKLLCNRLYKNLAR